MAVMELALLHIRTGEPLSARPGRLTDTLRAAQRAQAAFSGYPVHLYTQDEDPSYIYLVGAWDSVGEHLGTWIPSRENQELLSALQDEIEVLWMFHVEEIDFGLLGVNLGIAPAEKTKNHNAPVGAPEGEILTRISFRRYLINEGAEREAISLLRARLATIVASSRRTGVLVGWRIEREDDGRELVLLVGGAASSEMQESTGLEQLIRTEEVKCGTLLDA
ncbi:predicted protein [Paecilomyces variotii No. 5]|uniref:ABM domain-containing protein n=1 Tax=Byssochlamys spectabilis (strain No. 5 / NBRC 109023) TaxID=1356009 RepID=V5G2G7_BYSSN|nr:predicted protein [Paecilomyces variotii No. 5]